MRRGVALAGLLLLAGVLRAQEAPVGVPQSDAPLRDVEFGVTVRQFGLERRVEMLQWQSTLQGYQRTWSDEPIDSSHFDTAHANPVDWPLPGRRWLAKSAVLDGKPLDAAVVAALGEWRDFRPSFNALPDNMAVTFQPEGDGLGSADNPLAPEVGDLRVRWRQLVLPALQGRVWLRDGRWQLAPSDGDPAQAAAAPSGVPAAQPPSPSDGSVRAGSPARWWVGGGILALLLAILFVVYRQRASRGQE
jgi:hypothetical protein